jgi:hypothetical protein
MYVKRQKDVIVKYCIVLPHNVKSALCVGVVPIRSDWHDWFSIGMVMPL